MVGQHETLITINQAKGQRSSKRASAVEFHLFFFASNSTGLTFQWVSHQLWTRKSLRCRSCSSLTCPKASEPLAGTLWFCLNLKCTLPRFWPFYALAKYPFKVIFAANETTWYFCLNQRKDFLSFSALPRRCRWWEQIITNLKLGKSTVFMQTGLWIVQKQPFYGQTSLLF